MVSKTQINICEYKTDMGFKTHIPMICITRICVWKHKCTMFMLTVTPFTKRICVLKSGFAFSKIHPALRICLLKYVFPFLKADPRFVNNPDLCFQTQMQYVYVNCFSFTTRICFLKTTFVF